MCSAARNRNTVSRSRMQRPPRHPGMAGLIAGMHFSDSKVMLAVLLFLFAGILLSAIYAGWLARYSELRSVSRHLLRLRRSHRAPACLGETT